MSPPHKESARLQPGALTKEIDVSPNSRDTIQDRERLFKVPDPLDLIRQAAEALPDLPAGGIVRSPDDPEPWPAGSPKYQRFRAALAALGPVDVPISRNPSPKEGPSRVEGIRVIGTARRCASPVGLMLEADAGIEARPVPCRKCPDCRTWDRQLDAERVTEAMTAPTVAYIPEDRWEATRKRLQRSALPYLSVPMPGGKRALISELAGPAEPVSDLPTLLADLEGRRDRLVDRRRVSSGGLRSRAAVEAEIYSLPAEPEPRRVVGYYSPRAVSPSSDLADLVDALEAEATGFGVPCSRDGLAVVVEARRHDPRAELLWRRLAVRWLPEAVPWMEGGPPPTEADPGWEAYAAAVTPRPPDPEIPWEAYRAELSA